MGVGGQVRAGSTLTAGGVKFYSVVELVEKDSSVSSLLKVFNDQNSSDRIVQFLRLLTSAFIRNRADFFRHFIDEEMDIKDFCTHVSPPRVLLGDVAPSLGFACLSLTHSRSTVGAQRNALTMPTCKISPLETSSSSVLSPEA